MKEFLDDQFLLHSRAAQTLYHDHVKGMPIIDQHCHLPLQPITADHQFENLTQAWLCGDHHKWRAMRINGADEGYCTGTRTDWEKFRKWSETVPNTLRNPLYHWTHLELRRYFGSGAILNPKTARRIYDACSEKLRSREYSVRSLLRKMKVTSIFTSDDPVDNLEHHLKLRQEGFEIPVLPAFCPDHAINVDDPAGFNAYIRKLEAVTNVSISNFSDYLFALENRHDFFASMGCTISNHGLKEMRIEEFSGREVESAFNKIHTGQWLNELERRKFRSAMLALFAEWNWGKDWVQQFHLGNGAEWDPAGGRSQSRDLARFLEGLGQEDRLARTVVYDLDPSDNGSMANMIANINDASVSEKIQFGSTCRCSDQHDGVIGQVNGLSNMGLLNRFAGMLTNTCTFLSYPRHEYFRRTLCNIFGNEITNGELPNDPEWIGKTIQDICYYNAKRYFDPRRASTMSAYLDNSGADTAIF